MMTHEEMTLFLQSQFGLNEDNADSLAHCLDVLKECQPDEKSPFELTYRFRGDEYGSSVMPPQHGVKTWQT